MIFINIINELKNISIVSTNESESWSNLTFHGEYSGKYSKSYFSQLHDCFNERGISNAITLYIDNEQYDITDFVNTLSEGDKWEIHINKNVWLGKPDIHGVIHTFFLIKRDFINWAKETNPFKSDNPFNENLIHIYVANLDESFGGPNFLVNDSDDIDSWLRANYTTTISPDIIESTVRIRCSDEFIIDPQKHIVTIGKVSNDSQYFFRNSIAVLLASLCDEVLSPTEISIRGHRILKLQIGSDIFDKNDLSEYQKSLISTVQWMFKNNDDSILKKKLFADLVSLDLNYELSLYEGLRIRIQEVESQIKEQYRFVLFDRKAEYQNELKELLKDIKGITDTFSDKIRSILSNLLRDVLAALVLVGITLFSQIKEILQLSENNLLNYVFDAFGIYFCASITLQAIFDSLDINKSFKDLEYWKDVTHNYISQKQFQEYKDQFFGKRFYYMIGYYTIIVIIYIGISIACFNYSSIWSNLLQNVPKQDVEYNGNIPTTITKQNDLNIDNTNKK